jgi:hypothetical protein
MEKRKRKDKLAFCLPDESIDNQEGLWVSK